MNRVPNISVFFLASCIFTSFSLYAMKFSDEEVHTADSKGKGNASRRQYNKSESAPAAAGEQEGNIGQRVDLDKQTRDFHQRFMRLHPEWFRGDEIQPITFKSIVDEENQRPFSMFFEAKIHHCNEVGLFEIMSLSVVLETWNKITSLDLSYLRIGSFAKRCDLFKVVGDMQQLAKLRFEYNKSDFSHDYLVLKRRREREKQEREEKKISELNARMFESFLFGTEHARESESERPHFPTFRPPEIDPNSQSFKLGCIQDNYFELASCLAKLKNLQELHIQGLWLESHGLLGSGCIPNDKGGITISSEVATLIEAINHNQQRGIRKIIESICALKKLQSLSIDSIPDHGCSYWPDMTTMEKMFFAPYHLLFSPLSMYTGDACNAAMKQLVIDAAHDLAAIRSLKTISVYSPGGNCVDFFSKEFIRNLAADRFAAMPQLPAFTIKAEVLQ